MAVALALGVGVLYAAGFFLIMRRSFVKLVLGLTLLGHAANLLILTSGRLTRGIPPIVPVGATAPEPGFADPLPQALILTAIVIGFGVQAFALVLLQAARHASGTDDLETLEDRERARP
jgi:multicomponent Na+:H+ antiporter subunit C